MVYRFFGKRYSQLILSIREKKNIHDYSKMVDMTTTHLSNVFDHWSKIGFIEKIRKGREVEIKFTELGKEWKELVNKFKELDAGLKKKINHERDKGLKKKINHEAKNEGNN